MYICMCIYIYIHTHPIYVLCIYAHNQMITSHMYILYIYIYIHTSCMYIYIYIHTGILLGNIRIHELGISKLQTYEFSLCVNGILDMVPSSNASTRRRPTYHDVLLKWQLFVTMNPIFKHFQTHSPGCIMLYID